jgi:hypothetical protein
MMMEAVRNPETSVYSNETTRRYTPEDSKLHIIQSFIESLQASECSVCIDIYFLLIQPKTGTLADTLKKDHVIIILVIFCLILSGMCCTFIFNCVRKLIHDHSVIQVSISRIFGCMR